MKAWRREAERCLLSAYVRAGREAVRQLTSPEHRCSREAGNEVGIVGGGLRARARGLNLSRGLWEAVEGRGMTFLERCSRKINLAFLGHLKLETLWNLLWVINECFGVTQADNGLQEEMPSFGDCPHLSDYPDLAKRETQPPAQAPPRSSALE